MLSEWHLSPEYILENWTEPQIEAFWDARNHRILQTSRALQPPLEDAPPPGESVRIAAEEFFTMSGIGEA